MRAAGAGAAGASSCVSKPSHELTPRAMTRSIRAWLCGRSNEERRGGGRASPHTARIGVWARERVLGCALPRPFERETLTLTLIALPRHFERETGKPWPLRALTRPAQQVHVRRPTEMVVTKSRLRVGGLEGWRVGGLCGACSRRSKISACSPDALAPPTTPPGRPQPPPRGTTPGDTHTPDAAPPIRWLSPPSGRLSARQGAQPATSRRRGGAN